MTYVIVAVKVITAVLICWIGIAATFLNLTEEPDEHHFPQHRLN